MKNRKVRRAMAKMPYRTDWNHWEMLDLASVPKEMQPPNLKAAYRNNLFAVQEYEHEVFGEKVTVLGISRHKHVNDRPVTWAHKQRIKNELCGHFMTAYEVFPSEENLIDAADMYWLWVLPETVENPFKLFAWNNKTAASDD